MCSTDWQNLKEASVTAAALDAVRGERAYQDCMWTDKDTSAAKFVVLLDAYVADLKKSHMGKDSFADDKYAGEQFRKIAAIAVRGMELNGTFPR